jgi:hypothetical protein
METHTLVEETLDDGGVHVLSLVHLHNLGSDDLVRELAHGITEHLLLLRDGEEGSHDGEVRLGGEGPARRGEVSDC